MGTKIFVPVVGAALATFLLFGRDQADAAQESLASNMPYAVEATFLSASVDYESDAVVVNAEGRLPSRCWQYRGTRIEIDSDSNQVHLFPYKILADNWCPPGLASFTDKIRLDLAPGLWTLKFAGFANTKLVTR